MCGVAYLFRISSYNTFHLSHVYHREKLRKQQECAEEEPKGEQVFPDIENCGVKHGPTGRNVVSVQRGNNDYKALKPHSNIHND